MRREKRQSTSTEEELWLISYADMMTLLVGFFILLQSFSRLDSTKFEQIKKETTKVFGGEYKIPFEDITKKLKEVVERDKLADQVDFVETDEGVEITFRGALFFDSGSAAIKPQALSLLTKLAPSIRETAKDFGIVVEGHTDDRPVNVGVFHSNWELSSVRACAVLRFFENNGFVPKKLKAIGWAEHKPIVPNKNENGISLPDNQSQNRRVVVKIVKNFET